MLSEEAAYLAGLLDGEGSFMIQRSSPKGKVTWHATISMGTTTPELAWRCKELAGGGVFGPTSPKSPTASPAWIWQLKGRAVGPLIEEMWPFIVLKRPQAALLHRLRSEIEPGARRGQKGRAPLDDATRYRRETMRLACRALNRRGVDPIPEAQMLALESAQLLDLIRPPLPRRETATPSPHPVPEAS